MTTQNARWELSQLYKLMAQIKSQGRELDYYDRQRIEKLQKFLDSQDAEGSVTTEPKTETKTADEIPF